LDPSWLCGEFTYPDFIDEIVSDRYSDKHHDEKLRIFIGTAKNGMGNWKNSRNGAIRKLQRLQRKRNTVRQRLSPKKSAGA
jgi:hypothetical protein